MSESAAYFFECLIGEKVILRPFSISNITNEYVDWLNDPEVVKYSNQRFVKHTLTSCQKYFLSFENTANLFIKIENRADNLFVGTMTAYVSIHHQTVDIGIMIGRISVWSGGIGQDAWNTLLNWFMCQKSIRKITAGAMQSNVPMIKIMRRSGMILEAIRPNQELLNGEPENILYYGKYTSF